MFKISITDKPIPDNRKTHRNESGFVATLTINEFSERIHISTDIWSIDHYYKQWLEGVDRLNMDSISTSAIVISASNIDQYEYPLDVLSLFRDDEKVFVQWSAHKWPSNEVPDLANLKIFYDSLGSRLTDVSEWTISLSDINKFKDSLKIKI